MDEIYYDASTRNRLRLDHTREGQIGVFEDLDAKYPTRITMPLQAADVKPRPRSIMGRLAWPIKRVSLPPQPKVAPVVFIGIRRAA